MDGSDQTLKRSLASRIIRLLAVAVVAASMAWFVINNWDQVSTALVRLHPGLLVVAVLAATVGIGFGMLSWRGAMATLGTRIGVLDAAHVYFVGQLAKYVPGSVWAVVAQVELARRYGASRAVTAVASIVQMLVSVLTGLAVGGVSLLVAGSDALAAYWWAFAVGVVGAVGLLPPVFRWGVRLLGRLARRDDLRTAQIESRALGATVGWCLAMWVAFAAHFACILAPFVRSIGDVFAAGGAYAFAWVVGFVIVILPAGAGAREGVLVLALAPIAGAASALTAALVSRFVMLAADLIVAAAGSLIQVGSRRRSPDAHTVAASSARADPPATSD